MRLLILILLLISSKLYSQTYFPYNDFKMDDCEQLIGLDTMLYLQFTDVLRHSNEPSLLETSFDHPVYRFTWMPSFSPNHVITIHFTDTPYVSWQIWAYEDFTDSQIQKWTDSKIYNETPLRLLDSLLLARLKPSEINDYLDKKLFIVEDNIFDKTSGQNWLHGSMYKHAFERILSDLGFWEDDTMGPCSDREGFTDGSEWLFEGASDGKYKCVSRSIPDDGSKYYLLGLYFFKTAKFDYELEDIY